MKARKVDNKYEGGIAWERSDRAVNIGNSERCYTLAQSYQIQRNLAGPTTGTRDVDSDEWHAAMRAEVIKVCFLPFKPSQPL